ncbi:MOSC domain-containing protein [Undibacterium terreum]|uniref:Fe-S protein n=1 Tax=Undibacterium terreum TaxID=1224302 RepID=A0A916XN64_9BURK|nr:MOSC N-terminal beta barrel domain-containing protein [Undibacterium terreum]GGC88888.1 Fe-S protein [Undibacterium terreum]
MPTITELTLYPIKSCAGIPLREATVTATGLSHDFIYDREWMVVNDQGQFLTQREHPRMALIQPSIQSEKLVVRAPGMLPLEIPLDLPDPASAATLQVQVWDSVLNAYDCDLTTATWFSNAVGTPCRLVRFHPDAQRLASKKWTGDIDVPTMFADGYPMLLISAASLEDLNGRLQAQGRSSIPMNRFRPNIVMDGIEAYEEDYAESFDIGSIRLKPVKPCPRCPMPSVDQATGQFGPDPMDILQTYRANPLVDGGITFGMNLILLSGEDQVLRVGDEVELSLAF